MSEDRFAGIEEKLHILVSGQAELKVGLGDEIKQIAEGHGATQAAIARGVETVCAHIDRRIDPLEQVVRQHAAILEAHHLTLPERR